jgi:hypothetical protein
MVVALWLVGVLVPGWQCSGQVAAPGQLDGAGMQGVAPFEFAEMPSCECERIMYVHDQVGL